MVMGGLSSVFLPKTPSFPRRTHSLLPNPPSAKAKMSIHACPAAVRRHKQKLVVIMGPTGCGKSKLSIDLVSRFFRASEIINSDKIQVYRGLSITTNKLPVPERRNVPHHLLGESDAAELTPADFRAAADSAVSQILARCKLPFLVGGSTSLIYASIAKEFNPEIDVFSESSTKPVFCNEIRYDCCFLWIDVVQSTLNQYLSKRVDDMLDSGMYEELSQYLQTPESRSASKRGLNQAIGVPEFRQYFDKVNAGGDRSAAYEEAVRAIKEQTIILAKRQVMKILRLRDEAGWGLQRLDATAAFRARMSEEGQRFAAEVWESEVVQPSVKIVEQFLRR